MIINHDKEKLYNAIVFFTKNTKFCGITKLCKLLYYLDFLHFRETGRSVTGLDYYAWQQGPVPKNFYFEIKNKEPEIKEYVHIIEEDDKTNFTPIVLFDKKHFTKRELRILDEVAFIFKEARAKDMTEASHLPNHPWDKTLKTKGEKEKIDYLLAIDNTDKSLSIEEAQERILEKEEMEKVFNG